MIKRDKYGYVEDKGADEVRYNDDGSNGEDVKKADASNSKDKEAEIEKRINALALKHLSSVLGEHTIKVIGYHLSSMDVDIYNLCDEPKKVEDALYSLFRESSKMLISEVVNILYTEFNITDGKCTTLEDAIKRIKAIDR
ncbi:MAG: hypothetical protein ACK4FV_04445 [Candidatus Nitrosocaldus sp.]